MKRWYAVLCLICLLLMGGVWRQWARLRRELNGVQQELAVSVAAWQATAAVKEDLQAELKEVQEATREAQLSLEESTQKAEEITAQLAELTAQKEALEQEIAALRPAP